MGVDDERCCWYINKEEEHGRLAATV